MFVRCPLQTFLTADPPASPALGHELGPNGAPRDGGRWTPSAQRYFFLVPFHPYSKIVVTI
jgi:hypothetical protein